MTDIRSTWDSWLTGGDWLIDPPALDDSADLETAVLISLFSDARAGADDTPPGAQDDRRGWWADMPSTEHADRGSIGSKLWLLTREKATNDVRLRAEEYCRNALAWMRADGVADRIEVAAAWAGLPADPGRLEIEVGIYRAGALIFARRYNRAWAQAGAPIARVGRAHAV